MIMPSHYFSTSKVVFLKNVALAYNSTLKIVLLEEKQTHATTRNAVPVRMETLVWAFAYHPVSLANQPTPGTYCSGTALNGLQLSDLIGYWPF